MNKPTIKELNKHLDHLENYNCKDCTTEQEAYKALRNAITELGATRAKLEKAKDCLTKLYNYKGSDRQTFITPIGIILRSIEEV